MVMMIHFFRTFYSWWTLLQALVPLQTNKAFLQFAKYQSHLPCQLIVSCFENRRSWLLITISVILIKITTRG